MQRDNEKYCKVLLKSGQVFDFKDFMEEGDTEMGLKDIEVWVIRSCGERAAQISETESS